MEHRRVRRMVYAALCLALCLVLPFLTGQIREIGNMLCPMHLPVLLCGYLCGGVWGAAVGFVAPLLRSVLFGMPRPIYPLAAAMALELAAYGALSGILYRVLPKKTWGIYASLALAMVGGRLVWGAARLVFAGLDGTAFPFEAFLAGAVLNAVPGILLQLVLVPLIVLAVRRAGHDPDGRP